MNQRGAALMIVIVILVVVAVVLSVFVSLINTESFTAMNQSASVRAFGIADGGVEYILKNRAFPAYSMAGSSISLGSGSFSVDTPARTAILVPGGAGVSITVNETEWFEDNPTAGLGTVGLVIGGEEIECTSITPSTTFNTCNAISGGPVVGGQAVDTEVYPLTILNTGGPPLGVGATTVTVNSTRGFLQQGTISIGKELIYYSGTTATTFTGCIRGYKSTPATAHPNGRSVYQYIITSIGTVPLPVTGSAKRVLRVTAGVLN